MSKIHTFEACASYQVRKIAGCACIGNAGNIFPATHVPWCIPGSLTNFEVGGEENVTGIPGACATRNSTYLVRGLWRVKQMQELMSNLTRFLQTHPHIALGLYRVPFETNSLVLHRPILPILISGATPRMSDECLTYLHQSFKNINESRTNIGRLQWYMGGMTQRSSWRFINAYLTTYYEILSFILIVGVYSLHNHKHK